MSWPLDPSLPPAPDPDETTMNCVHCGFETSRRNPTRHDCTVPPATTGE